LVGGCIQQTKPEPSLKREESGLVAGVPHDGWSRVCRASIPHRSDRSELGGLILASPPHRTGTSPPFRETKTSGLIRFPR
jgi:hypothetical protein